MNYQLIGQKYSEEYYSAERNEIDRILKKSRTKSGEEELFDSKTLN